MDCMARLGDLGFALEKEEAVQVVGRDVLNAGFSFFVRQDVATAGGQRINVGIADPFAVGSVKCPVYMSLKVDFIWSMSSYLRIRYVEIILTLSKGK